MTATVPLGALVGAIIGGWLAAPWGRRSLLMSAAVLFVIGALICALAPSILGALARPPAARLRHRRRGADRAALYLRDGAGGESAACWSRSTSSPSRLGIFGAYLVGFAVGESWRIMFATAMVPGALLLDRRLVPVRHAALAGAARPPPGGGRGDRPGPGPGSGDPNVTGELAAIELAARAGDQHGELARAVRPAGPAGLAGRHRSVPAATALRHQCRHLFRPDRVRPRRFRQCRQPAARHRRHRRGQCGDDAGRHGADRPDRPAPADVHRLWRSGPEPRPDRGGGGHRRAGPAMAVADRPACSTSPPSPSRSARCPG